MGDDGSLVLDTGAVTEADVHACRHEIMMRTVAEITTVLTGEFELNDVLMMVLEGMYRGLGVENVLLAMLTPQRDRVVFRFGLGPKTDELQEIFSVPLTSQGGAVATCVRERCDVIIPNFSQHDHAGDFPPALLEILNPRSIVLLPIVIRDSPLGLFLVNRGVDQSALTPQEIQSMRALGSQAVLAIHQASMLKRA